MENKRLLLLAPPSKWLRKLAAACRADGFQIETASSFEQAKTEFADANFDLLVKGKRPVATDDDITKLTSAFANGSPATRFLFTSQRSIPVLLEEIRAALFQDKPDSPIVHFEKGNPSKVIVKTDGGCHLEVQLLNLNWFFQTSRSPIFSQKIEPGETHISLKRQLPRWLLRAFVIVKTDSETRLVIPF